MKTSAKSLGAGAACALAGLALVFAGPLDPPAGPIASTYKTLAEVEPRTAVNSANTPGDGSNLYRITQPGSYYLTGNITGVSGKNGISIEASAVKLDLNGFAVTGVPGSGEGVTVTVNSLKNISVINGTVQSWGQAGVNLFDSSTISNSLVADVIASGNGNNGISTTYGANVVRCTAGNNGGHGIATGNNSVVSQCTVYGNTYDGISVLQGVTVIGCTSNTSGQYGIETGNACTIVDCTVQGGSLHGIVVSTGCTVSRCTSYDNQAFGIVATNGCTITDCMSRTNGSHGIQVAAGCLVRGNDCTNNGSVITNGAGIFASGGNNRIEDNNCTSADYGILLTAAGNYVVRNTCSGNLINWSFAANNVFGPILDRRTPASAAVSGNAAASSLGTTDANANFSY